MGFRFQRRFRILPGIRLNVSASGVSTSIGRRGAWFTIGPRGTRTTVGIPGTGLSYTEQHGFASRSAPTIAPPAVEFHEQPAAPVESAPAAATPAESEPITINLSATFALPALIYWHRRSSANSDCIDRWRRHPCRRAAPCHPLELVGVFCFLTAE